MKPGYSVKNTFKRMGKLYLDMENDKLQSKFKNLITCVKMPDS